MKVLQIFAHFSDEQWKLLVDRYPNEQALKVFLHERLTGEIKKEVDDIKLDKALEVFGAPEKL